MEGLRSGANTLCIHGSTFTIIVSTIVAASASAGST